MKELNFNSVQRPTIVLTMRDDAQTVLHVSAPKESLVEELQVVAGELKDLAQAGDQAGLEAVFDLVARLMSCNRDYIKITSEELRGKYRMDLEDVIIFFGAYLDFIGEITKAKN